MSGGLLCCLLLAVLPSVDGCCASFCRIPDKDLSLHHVIAGFHDDAGKEYCCPWCTDVHYQSLEALRKHQEQHHADRIRLNLDSSDDEVADDHQKPFTAGQSKPEQVGRPVAPASDIRNFCSLCQPEKPLKSLKGLRRHLRTVHG